MSVKTVLMTTRGPFLILAPACVFLGAASARYQGFSIDLTLLLLTALGALLAHVSVNTFNEFADFRSGLDLQTVRTPFSGGSGALPDNPGMAQAVFLLAVFSLLLTIVIGLYLMSVQGLALAPIGLLGLLTIVLYTPWINRYALLCLVAPGLGFGYLMVVGTQVALTGEYTEAVWWAATVPFLQVNNLLLLNQFPDIDADKRAGRKHLAIRFGLPVATAIFGLFAVAAPMVIIVGVALGILPAWSLLALITVPAALISWVGARRYGALIGAHPPFMAANVVTAIFTPVLLGVGLLLG